MATVGDILSEPILIVLMIAIIVCFIVGLWLKTRQINRINKVHHHHDDINNKVDSTIESKEVKDGDDDPQRSTEPV